MTSLTRDAVLHALRSVADPASGRDVVAAGLVSGVTLRGGKAGFLLNAAPGAEAERLAASCEQAVRSLPGIESVSIVLTAHRDAPAPAENPRAQAQWNRAPVEGVSRILLVGSGKGGVGKSTTSVQVALALGALGLRVGLLDADVYGPSLPRMLGMADAGQPVVKNGKMVPHLAHGIACMSAGFLLGGGAAALRGPMVGKTLQQMLRLTQWDIHGALDWLVVDMPPGTGDIHISLAQQAPVDAGLIVTTPQEVAVEDAEKCADLFGKLGIPVLGVVENMSWFTDPMGTRHALFGEGGGQALAGRLGIPLLAQVPLEPQLRAAADCGDYSRLGDGEAAQAYGAIARRIAG